MYGDLRWGDLGARPDLDKLTPSDGGWSYTDLHDFHQLGSDGCYPLNSMVQDAAGNLYGVTAACGSGGYGVVFEITP